MKTVGILLFDDVELRTFADALTLFSAAVTEDAAAQPLFRVVSVAAESRAVTCEGGLQIQPEATILHHPPLDVLLIPGGWGRRSSSEWRQDRVIEWMHTLVAPTGKGIRRERHNALLLDWICEQDRRVELLVGICTGTVLLAECGLLSGWRATTPADLATWWRMQYPLVRLTPDVPLVDEGHVLTAAGRYCAVDATLQVITRMYGARTALSAASCLDRRGRCVDSGRFTQNSGKGLTS